MKAGIGISLVVLAAYGLWNVVSFLVRRRWVAPIPADLQFERLVETKLGLRDVAEVLSERFGGTRESEVVCLGPVRGNAGRLLFHAGPKNRGRGEIHRPDYLLCVERRGASKVALVLRLNRPYSYFRIRRSEVEPLVRALGAAYGDLNALEASAGSEPR